MIEQNHAGNIQGSALKSQDFSIAVNESMFKMLTSKVYTDTVLACMREWSTNAVDACKAASKEISFDVHLPTTTEPHFSVRDYGIGLAKDDIIGLFCTLGASTKRDSNAYNGSFGIGRMAGLAYADAFTVESWHKGRYYSYMIAIDNGTPKAIELADKPTTESDGLKLQVAVKLADINRFKSTAKNLYKHFQVKPNLNIDLDLSQNITLDISKDWYLDDSLPGWRDNYVLMADVLYRIDDDTPQIETNSFKKLVLKVPTGAVSINPGRESLSFDQPTIDYINKRFEDAAKEYLEYSLEAIEDLDTPIQRLEAIHTATEHAPYGIARALSTEAAPLVSDYVYVSRSGSNIQFTHPNIQFKQKVAGYEKLQDAKNFSWYKIYPKMSVLLVDKKTNWRSALTKYQDTALVLSRPTGVDFDTFVTDAKQWLADLGHTTYDLASELVTNETPAEKAAREGIYVSTYASYNSSWGKAYKYQPDQKYLYVPLSGSSYQGTIDKKALYFAYEHFLEESKYKLVGVPKKYLKLAEQHPNFTRAEPYIVEHMRDQTVYQRIDDYATYSTRHFTEIETAEYVPTLIRTYIQEYKQYREYYNTNSTYSKESIETLQNTFDIKVEEFKRTVSPIDLEKYRLLNRLLSAYDYRELEYYLELEFKLEQANEEPSLHSS